jgi:dihydropteroate synthase
MGKQQRTVDFHVPRTLVMGILNVTPDSFSDGGTYLDPAMAVERALQMVDEGADIIDIGGESTRPGATPIDALAETERVIPVVRAVCRATSTPVSVDTYKVAVARLALAEGAAMLNDVWGGQREPAMLALAVAAKVPICLMHNRAEPRYRDLIGEIKCDLASMAEQALRAGVPRGDIILDPGIGFGKTWQQNLVVMQRLREIVDLGFPLLIGTSRKSMIGHVLGLPVDERLEGTAATVAYSIAMGAKIVRVHDVKAMKRVAQMTDALMRGGTAVD